MEHFPRPSFLGFGGFFGGEPVNRLSTKGVWCVFDRAFLPYFPSSDREMIDFLLRLCYNFSYEKVSVYFI